MTRIGLWILLLAFVGLSGCGGDGRNSVEGVVRLDGEPIQSGTIRFVPVDGHSPPEGSLITDGQYSLQIAPGSYRVHIQGYKVVGQKHHNDDPTAPLMDVTEPIVPAKYDQDSQETREIEPGSQTLDFDLKSQ